MISKELSNALEALPSKVDKSKVTEFLTLRDKILKICKATDKRYFFQESRLNESNDPWILLNKDRFINLLNEICCANYRLVLKHMSKKGFCGDDIFQELYIILRETILTFDPSKGSIQTLFLSRARRIWRLKRKKGPPLAFLPGKELQSKIKQFKAEFIKQFDRKPTLKEIELAVGESATILHSDFSPTYDNLRSTISKRDMKALFSKHLTETEAEVCSLFFLENLNFASINQSLKIKSASVLMKRAVKKLKDTPEILEFLKEL